MRQGLKHLMTLLFVVSLITLGACSDEFHKDDLVGTYVLNTRLEMDMLELKSDGDYVHGYQEKGSSKETIAGKWELEKTPDGQMVTLDHFRSLPGESTNGNGYFLLKPTRFFGSIRLVRNADLNEFYKKQ